MRSIGFYSNCDDAIQKKVKKYMDKATYTEYVKNFEEISPSMLMKHDFESGEYNREYE